MNISIDLPELADLRPRITVIGIGGAGCNAINNMIATGLEGVEFVAANTDAQALAQSAAAARVQLGAKLTAGLGAGAKPEIGREAAEEAADDVRSHIEGSHMVFLAAGMGGGTGTGAVSVIARIAREMGILTVAIVSKPFQFEGSRRMRTAEAGIEELRGSVDTLIVIPNQNLFRLANEKTTFAEAFILADQVLYSGIACIVDLIVKDGLINLDFADVKAIMQGMGTAMMGTGEATGENRATRAAEEAISNPLLDEISLRGAKGLLVSIIGGRNLTLFEVDEAASRVKQEADHDANIIVGASFEDGMDEKIRVSIVASGLPGSQAPGLASIGSTRASFEANSWQSRASQPQPGPAGTGLLANLSEAEPLADNNLTTELALATAMPDDEGRDTRDVEHHKTAPEMPPELPVIAASEDAGQLSDPYLGDTSADEFARALSEVIGTVAHTDGDRGADQLDRSVGRWQSSDGVVIEDGFEPAMASPPPPLPVSKVAGPAPNDGRFTPAAPAEPPRRVPNISEFPDIAQRQYHAHAEGSEDQADVAHQHESGVQSIFRRLASLGRQQQQQVDSPTAESVTRSASATAAQSDTETQGNDTNLPPIRRYGRYS